MTQLNYDIFSVFSAFSVFLVFLFFLIFSDLLHLTDEGFDAFVKGIVGVEFLEIRGVV